MKQRGAYVYILASKRNGTLYIGFAHDLAVRLYQHETGEGSEFVEKYGVFMLVYYEYFEYAQEAIKRETRLKKWNREWKIRLIEEMNPEWKDLRAALNN